MNRLLVALLAAVDAVIAAAVGVAVIGAPLILLWVFGLGSSPDWGALWPAIARVWESGHLVAVHVALPEALLTNLSIPADQAAFTVSLAPLAFVLFTALFAARSGRRAAHAGAWPTGVIAGSLTFAVAAAVIWATSHNAVAQVSAWQAIVLPTCVFALPALCGAMIGAWIEGDAGAIDALRRRWSVTPPWADVPAAIARGTAIALVGLVGAGALIVVAALAMRGGSVISLFQASNVDLLGAISMTLGQLAYIPTLAIWGAAFIAGPGFAVGSGTSVSPSGTSLGVVPGIPVLGALPSSGSSWLLLLSLIVVAVGVIAGWSARAHLLASGDDHMPARASTWAGISVFSGIGAALLGWMASGAFGPLRLADLGPHPLMLGLVVAGEVALGAGILLFGPRRESQPHEGDNERPHEVTFREKTDTDAHMTVKGLPVD